MNRSIEILCVAAVVVGLGTAGSGLVFANGFAGNAIRITNDEQLVLIPNAPSLNPTSAITVEAWYKPELYGGAGYEPVVEKPYLSHTSPHYQYTVGPGGLSCTRPRCFGTSFSLVPDDGGPIVRVPTTSSANTVTDAGYWSPGQWYHLAMVVDGASISMFVDGTFIGSEPAVGSIAAFDTPVTIGNHLNYPTALRGDIDEVRIWEVARTPEQITANYNKIIDPATPGLVGYWNFDETDGQAVYDQTSYDNDGTLGLTDIIASDDAVRVVSDAPIVPEPATLGMLALGGLAMVRRRKRRMHN